MNDYTLIPLAILVFGPSPRGSTVDTHLEALRKKRDEIRVELQRQAASHTVHYGEDIRDSKLPPPVKNNAFFQEDQALREYDLVVVLVYSPGTNVELGQIAGREQYARKAVLFLDAAFEGSYADSACEAAETFAALYCRYDYPTDITDCHLLSRVMERVGKVQFAKYMS